MRKSDTHPVQWRVFTLLLLGVWPTVAYAQANRDSAKISRWAAIVEKDRAEYEKQLKSYARSLENSEKALRDAVSVLSQKKTSLAIAEKQALRDGARVDDERSTKRLTLAVKFAEGEVDLQQRRVLRLTRKLDEARTGLRLNQEAKEALVVLERDKALVR